MIWILVRKFSTIQLYVSSSLSISSSRFIFFTRSDKIISLGSSKLYYKVERIVEYDGENASCQGEYQGSVSSRFSFSGTDVGCNYRSHQIARSWAQRPWMNFKGGWGAISAP